MPRRRYFTIQCVRGVAALGLATASNAYVGVSATTVLYKKRIADCLLAGILFQSCGRVGSVDSCAADADQVGHGKPSSVA